LKRISPVPIFIISYNRLAVLRQAINSFRQIDETKVIVHDAGSSYAPLLKFLAELEREGASVYYDRQRIVRDDDLNSVADTVSDWLQKHDASHYVVTDPDVALEDGCRDILEFYQSLLDEFPDVEVVGPMLRIDDIPDSFPLKRLVIQRHTNDFWHKPPEWIAWKGHSRGSATPRSCFVGPEFSR
jgi:hypothetical protein